MIVTLTVKMAEDLTQFLKERGIKVVYLHHETKTLERTEVQNLVSLQNYTAFPLHNSKRDESLLMCYCRIDLSESQIYP